MFVKYQDNLIVPQYVWQIRETVALYHSIFRQCPWHIRSTTLSNFLNMCVTRQENCITVSSLFPTMSVTYQANYLVKGCEGENKRGRGRKEKMTVVRVTTTTLPVDSLTATDCNIATDAFFLTMGVTYHKNCITSNKSSGSVDCVQIIFFYFLLGLNIIIYVSNHSLVASIETKRKVMWTRSKLNSKKT